MKQDDFEKLKDFILDKNAYFNAGFANACKDDTTQAIYVRENLELKPVFPADNYGNYFYLRNEESIRHEAQVDGRATDNGAQRLTFLDTIAVQLVAIVKDADAYQLIENLVNTVMMNEGAYVQPITTMWNREQIVATELKGMKVDDMQSALQRLRHETIVRISMNMSKHFIPGNCIVNPIKQV
jgi:hypothetical protein